MNTASSLLSSFSMLIQDDKTFSLWLGDFIIQSSLILGTVWLLTSVAKNMSPARKHLLTVASIVSLPVLFLASIYLPILQWSVVDHKTHSQPQWKISVSHEQPRADAANKVLTPETTARINAASLPKDSLTFASVTVLVWAAGSLVLLGLLLLAWWRLAILSRKSKAANDEGILQLLQRVRAEAGYTHKVTLLVSQDTVMPMTWGMFSPKILLPSNFTEWPEERQLLVLRHEMAHIARGDAASSIITLLAASLCWLHPLMWLMWRRASMLREQACDDHVIAVSGQDAHDYADELIATLRDLKVKPTGATWLPALALAMASGSISVIKKRLAHALRENADRRAFTKFGQRGLVFMSFIATVLLSGLSACREVNKTTGSDAQNNSASALEEQRVYFLTDEQWKQLGGSDKPGSSNNTNDKASTLTDEELRSVALTIRTRLLENGIKFPQVIDKDVISLRDSRTLLVYANHANHEKLESMLTRFTNDNYIRIETQVFTIPMSKASELGLGISESPDQLSVLGLMSPEKFKQNSEKFLQSKDLVLVSAPSVTAKNAQTTNIEIVRELIYPSDFSLPQVADDKREVDGVTYFPVTPSTPTAFEMRPVGLRMTLTPRLEASDHIHLDLAPEVTYFDGFMNYGSPIKATTKNQLGAQTEVLLTENRVEQPVFRTLKCQTSVIVKSGDYLVLGGMATREDAPFSRMTRFDVKRREPDQGTPDRLLYFIVRATSVNR